MPGTQQSRLSLGADAPACAKDVDCEGELICTAGRCEPIPAPDPAELRAVSTGLRLAEIGKELEVLKQSRVGMALPVLLLVPGGSFSLVGLFVTIFVPWPGVVVGLIILAVAQLAVVIGMFGWIGNQKKNGAIEAASKKLQAERASLESTTRRVPDAPRLLELARF